MGGCPSVSGPSGGRLPRGAAHLAAVGAAVAVAVVGSFAAVDLAAASLGGHAMALRCLRSLADISHARGTSTVMVVMPPPPV